MKRVIRPQHGPQEQFLATSADIAIYGGAAGGGKTFALLMEPLRYINVSGYRAVIFRQSYNQINSSGGLWDESLAMYRGLKNAVPLVTPKYHWNFGKNNTLIFDYLGRDGDVYKWQGSQIAFIGFDELTHFSKRMFFYMLSRNRSTCGVKPYVRATCNPDSDSWVADFISWWINQDTGYPIPERSGKIRYMCVIQSVIYWADTPEELEQEHGISPSDCKSVTFIASRITDNQKLLDKDPSYLANLKALPEVDKERLLYGNWKIRPAAGMYFKTEQFTFVDAVPKNIIAYARSWDLAATEPTPLNPDPDATAGVLMGLLDDGRVIVLDVKRKQIKANAVRTLLRNMAAIDQGKYKFVQITIPQDPGQAGKAQAQSLVSMLAGYSVEIVSPTGSKEVRATPFASQVQAGNVLILKGEWNDMYLSELESFPESKHDDMVDASSDAFNKLMHATNWGGLTT
nr:MAG TPA: Large subunit terminase [Caudoviricetes sp.]